MQIYFKRVLFWSALLLSFTSQAQRFSSGIIVGANLSELAGDDISSYIGWHTGLKIATNLSERSSISTEFLFSQAGLYVAPVTYPLVNYGRIRLNYLEIPLYWTYAAFPKADYFQKKFSLGLAYTRLFDHQVVDIYGVNLREEVIWDERTALVGLLGVSHLINRQVEFNFRAALAKNKLDWAWTLTFRGIYNLSR
ncbi:MAG: outer membrane beta-barrel protein [Bacteroidota bacterium]